MRIQDKIEEIEKYIEELSEIQPESFEAYKNDFKTKAACERYFEKIIESVVDLAFLVIKENKLKIPEEDKEAFDVLAKGEIISKDLAEKLKDAKGMRNLIAHEYGKVDDEIVFESVTSELKIDTETFVKKIKQTIKKN
ncbi:DUF86 domain-containing protein [Candidatus Woesearchaeota archaeon]|nr:DUF86 domain-containing protein [Candidatus Woesearchaeota archaeon]